MEKTKNDNIKLSLLLLNIENPRFDIGSNQRDTIQKMIEDQGDKLCRLAKHIVEHGLNPSELAIVIPSERESGRYEVLEGNRRITALKILSTPTLIDAKYKSIIKKIKALSLLYKKKPIRDIPCVIFPNAGTAAKWVKLKHTGQNDGIGIVEWDNQQIARYDAKIEGKAPAIAIQIIDFLNKSIHFDSKLKPKLKDVPATNLGRLVGDPVFREFIGLSLQDGILQSQYEQKEIIKPLTKVVKDLLKKEFTVNDIYYKEDRKEYIEKFSKADVINQKNTTSPWELPTLKASSKATPVKVKKKSSPLSIDRKYLIPRDFIVTITDKRINKIYHELKDLEITEYENACSVLYRVFLELSVDAFVQKHKIPRITDNTELHKKVEAVASHLENKSIMTKAELKPIRTAASSTHSILAVNTFHSYVHNRWMIPDEKDLKISWDKMSLFLEKVLTTI